MALLLVELEAGKGRDSISDAPKDDEGMNGFKSPNPVV